MAGVSKEDSIRLLQLMGTVVGRGAMAVGVEYHGGWAWIGIKNTMVVGVGSFKKNRRTRRISTRKYVKKGARVKSIFNY